MRVFLNVIVCLTVGLIFPAGCAVSDNAGRLTPAAKDRLLFSVDFHQDEVLRYKFVSKRDVFIDFSAAKKKRDSKKSSVQKTTEYMELVMSYRPVEINTFGSTTIEAKCESADVRRTSASGRGSGKDAVSTLAGKTFRFDVTASGVIENRSELRDVIKQLGQAAFDERKGGKIKNPDMIFDFIAVQWFLWDSVMSIKSPSEGVSPGESWNSKLLVPLPVPMQVPRGVTYTLDEIKETDAGTVAVIKSSYSPAARAGDDWPMPYGGKFRMRGMFGFLQGYEVLQISGQGRELFNIDSGRIQSSRQQYEVKMKAGMPFGLGADSGIGEIKPNMTVKQEFTTQLLND